MDFNSKEELYKRVLPALRSKRIEFKNNGIDYIKEEDIWNFLIENNWRKAKDLSLAMVVDDILKCKYEDIDSYIKNKFKSAERTIYFDSELV